MTGAPAQDGGRAGIEESARELRRASVADVLNEMSLHMHRFSAYVHGDLRADLDKSPVTGRDIDGAMHCFKAAAGYMDAARSMLRKANGRLDAPATAGIRCARCGEQKQSTRPAKYQGGGRWIFGEPARLIAGSSADAKPCEYLCTDCEPER